MVQNPVILAMIALLYAIVGTLCLMWPEWLQALVIRKSEAAEVRHAFLTRIIESRHYVLYLQAVGAVSASAALAITLLLLERVKLAS
jgi:uncharacterized membrane protein